MTDETSTPTVAEQTTPTPSQNSSPPDDAAVEAAFSGGDDDSALDVDDDLMALAGAADPADDIAGSEPAKPTPAVPPATPSSAATPAAVTPAAVPPVTPAAPAAAPGATPAAPAAPAQPAQPAAAAPAAAQPAQSSTPVGEPTYAQVRESNIQKMADEVFVLDPKTLDEWDLDKSKQAKDLSKLAATIYMVAAESVIHSVAQQFPGWLQAHTQAQKATDELQNEFVSAFPGLKDHLDKVEPIAKAYRAANPKATKQEAIRAVGEIVHVTHGIPKPNAAPSAPSAPVRGTLPPAQLHGNAVPRVAPTVVAPANPYDALLALDAQDD